MHEDQPTPPRRPRMSVSSVVESTINGLIVNWPTLVAQFQEQILKNKFPKMGSMSVTAEQIPDFLHEEVNEIKEAYDADDLYGVIDGLCDLIYYAIGMSHQMGVHLGPYFLEVHLANMEKEHDPDAVPGVNKRVIKPEGWQEPRIAEIMAYMAKRRVKPSL